MYRSLVWNPGLTSDVTFVERIQRRFAKLRSSHENLSYIDRLRYLGALFAACKISRSYRHDHYFELLAVIARTLCCHSERARTRCARYVTSYFIEAV